MKEKNIKKELITGLRYQRYILSLSYNELDGYLEGNLSKYYFGNEKLFDYYKNKNFNYNCQIGSLLCILNLPDELNPCLIRGELLSNIEGKMFVHGWIEVTYKGEKYIIDTSIARAIPKKIYYKAYEPTVYVCIQKSKLLKNNYIKYFIEQLNNPNDFTLSKEEPTFFYGEGSWFDLYENYWLQNIEDNSHSRNIPILTKK